MYEPRYNWITFVYYIYLDGVRYGSSFYTSYGAVRAEIDRLTAEDEENAISDILNVNDPTPYRTVLQEGTSDYPTRRTTNQP